MKTSTWLNQIKKISFGMLLIVIGAFAWVACSVENVNPAAPGKNGKLKKVEEENVNANSNSQSNPGDYTITVTRNGKLWTYLICKNPGAKDLSHFILNLQNCGTRSVTAADIAWATVNGEPATLETSEGNTGCNVSEVTTNFVKFDDLPEADTYKIVFELDQQFGNFVNTTAWLKAGTSCHPYIVNAPCCPQ